LCFNTFSVFIRGSVGLPSEGSSLTGAVCIR